MPESYQIQDVLDSRNKFPRTFRENIVPSVKYINIIYEFSMARQQNDVWIAAVPESRKGERNGLGRREKRPQKDRDRRREKGSKKLGRWENQDEKGEGRMSENVKN